MIKNFTHIKELLNSKEVFQALMSFFLFVWAIFIAIPFDIVASNPEEFKFISGSSILQNGLFYAALAFLCLMILYAAISLIFKNYFRRLIFFIALALSVFVWLNSTFLTGVYGEFDGRGNLQIDPFSSLSWIQVGVFSGILLFAIFSRNKSKITTYTLALICSISLITGIINISSKLSQRTVSQGNESNFFVYSKNKPNILFILFDEYHTKIFDESRNIDEKTDEIYDGFTFFYENMSSFPRTLASMPATLAQKVHDEEIDLDIYETYKSFQEPGNYSLPIFLSEKSFDISVVGTHIAWLSYLFPNKNYITQNSNPEVSSTLFKTLMQYSLFRLLPDFFKPYIYNGGKWLRDNKLFNLLIPDSSAPYTYPNNTQFHDHGQSYHVLRDLKQQNIIARNTEHGYFKYTHSLITHSPIGLDKDCLIKDPETNRETRVNMGLCLSQTLNIFFNEMKSAGVYDNTMIVIASDHGFSKKNNFHAVHNKASALLLIKDFNARGPLKVDSYLTQNLDIPKTIADQLKFDHPFSKGVNILGTERPQNRIRIFNDYNWSPEYHGLDKGLPPIVKYRVTGSIHDLNNWTESREIIPLECNAHLYFHPDRIQYYTGILSIQEPWGRWSEEDLAEIKFQTEPDCEVKSITFNLIANVTPEHPEQTARVFANGKPVGDIGISIVETAKKQKQFTFALPDTEDNNYTIRFEIDNPISPKSLGTSIDERLLGFGFLSMKLSPDQITAQ